MNSNEKPDRLPELLRAGYAAPPPDPVFVQALGQRLENESRPGPRLSLSAQAQWRPIWRRFGPAALAASLVLAVTLTLLALRPSEPLMVSPGPAVVAQADRVEPPPAQRWAFAHPAMRGGETARLGEGLGDLPQTLNFGAQASSQPDYAAYFFALKPEQLGRAKEEARPILKEPEYQSKSPRYALLVFGPEAKTRVWVVLDLVSEPYDPKGNKDVLYVDRNGNGDLTEPNERVAVVMREHKFIPFVSFRVADLKEVTHYYPTFAAGEIIERDGKTRHTDLTIEVGEYLGRLRTCKVSLKVEGTEERTARDHLLRFSERPEDAPLVHFNGPLAMHLSMEASAIHVPVNYQGGEWDPPYREVKHLVRGQEMELYAEVGTPGVGAGTFLPISAGLPPKDAHPAAELEFPHQDPKQPALKVVVLLSGRC